MTNREHLLSLAVATALVAFSGVAKADDYAQQNAESAGTEDSAPVTCAQARADAWFMHELALSDGSTDTAAQPAECSRDLVAAKVDDATDPTVYQDAQ